MGKNFTKKKTTDFKIFPHSAKIIPSVMLSETFGVSSGIVEDQLRIPLKSLDTIGDVIYERFEEALNLSPMMPRDGSLSYSYTSYHCGFSSLAFTYLCLEQQFLCSPTLFHCTFIVFVKFKQLYSNKFY